MDNRIRLVDIDGNNYHEFKSLKITREQASVLGNEDDIYYFAGLMLNAAYNPSYNLRGIMWDDIPVGVCAYDICSVVKNNDYSDETPELLIIGFGIDKDHQRNHYGESAMQALLAEIVIKHGKRPVYIYVDSANIAAKRLYQKCGFVLDEWSKDHESDPDINLTMVKN